MWTGRPVSVERTSLCVRDLCVVNLRNSGAGVAMAFVEEVWFVLGGSLRALALKIDGPTFSGRKYDLPPLEA